MTARESFERWYVGHLFNERPPEIGLDQNGNYILMSARLAWQAYYAGWLHRMPDVGTDMPNAGMRRHRERSWMGSRHERADPPRADRHGIRPSR